MYSKAMSEAASKREAEKKAVAVVEPPPQIAPISNKREPWNKGKTHISRKTRAAITHLATKGGTVTEAAEAAGMSRSGLSKALQREGARALLDTEISRRLSISAARAAHTLDTLVSKARSERVQLEAATAILDRTGHGIGSELVQLGQAVQIHIDLSD